MLIQDLTVEDWARYRAIRLRALADAPDALARTLAEETGFDPTRWQARLGADAATFVTVVDRQDCGLATGAPWPGRPGVAGLFGMWVAPSARRGGVGLALIRAVAGWAQGAGFTRLALNVGNANARAIALYDRAGFVATGRTSTLPPPRNHIAEHERELRLGDHSRREGA